MAKLLEEINFKITNVSQVKKLLINLERKSSLIKKEEIFEEAIELNLNPQMVFKIIDRLKKRGEIYEPKKDVYGFLEI